MRLLPQQPMDIFQTTAASVILWFQMFWSMFPLSIIAGLLTSWPLYLKQVVNPQTQTILFVIILFIINIISLIPSNALFAKLGNAGYGQIITNSQSLGVSILRFPQTIVLSITLIIIIGAPAIVGVYGYLASNVLWILLGFIFIALVIMIYASMAFPLVINDKLPAFEALTTSFQLVKTHWWYVTLVTFLISAMGLLLQKIVTFLIIVPHVTFEQFPTLSVKQITILICVNMLVVPLHIATNIVLLQQLKIRSQAVKV